jgi:glutamate racemase
LVYFGDTARYPYGPKSVDEVRSYALQISDFLVAEHDVKSIVVACNTASAAALDDLKIANDVPVFGVIDAGVRSAIMATTTGRIGVIGTSTTVGSGAYQQAFAAADSSIELTCAACPGFVEFVERGETDSEQALILAERLLAPVVDAKVDSLLLGCTHYPFLARTISRVMGRSVTLVSSADETAFAVRAFQLANEGPATTGVTQGPSEQQSPAHRWISSGDASTFESIGRQLFGHELSNVEGHRWATP